MLKFRPANERGLTRGKWLNSRHTFSFGTYYHPNWTGFGHLAVLNDDIVQPKSGFKEHEHFDMEIITIMLAGQLEHKDTLGNTMVLRAGDVQRMTAGQGIFHSEKNPSPDEAAHFLQIWIEPWKRHLSPEYEQKQISLKPNAPNLVASNDGRDGSLHIHQNVNIYTLELDSDAELSFAIRPGHVAWIHMIGGEGIVCDRAMHTGDGLGVSLTQRLDLKAKTACQFLIIDQGS